MPRPEGRLALAAALGITVYWPVPSLAAVVAARDAEGGHPIVVSKPDSENAKVFRQIGGRVWAKLETSGAKAMPKILVQ